LGENDALTPLGSPEIASLTLPEKLGFASRNTGVDIELVPTPTESAPGGEIEKDGAMIPRDTVAVTF